MFILATGLFTLQTLKMSQSDPHPCTDEVVTSEWQFLLSYASNNYFSLGSQQLQKNKKQKQSCVVKL